MHRRAWYILRTGSENPDWEKLGGDYFIAPWEKRALRKTRRGDDLSAIWLLTRRRIRRWRAFAELPI